jgi:ribosomal protein S18 acetylase RimI-like enzyme
MLLDKKKIDAVQKRWEGQEGRLQKIADSIMRGDDWTIHLEGMPYLDDIPKLDGDKYPRDLRGANLRRYLMPTTSMEPASISDTPNIAYIMRESNRNNTPLRGISPFPLPLINADDVGLMMEKGSRFFMALQMGKVIGIVQMDSASEFKHLTEDKAYYEISNLSVLPAYRHLGVARAVLQEFVKFAGSEGKHQYILLRTVVEHGLVNYWERGGFVLREVYQRQHPKGAPASTEAIMTKKIV